MGDLVGLVQSVLTLGTVAALVAGTGLGIVIGALPGLG